MIHAAQVFRNYEKKNAILDLDLPVVSMPHPGKTHVERKIACSFRFVMDSSLCKTCSSFSAFDLSGSKLGTSMSVVPEEIHKSWGLPMIQLEKNVGYLMKLKLSSASDYLAARRFELNKKILAQREIIVDVYLVANSLSSSFWKSVKQNQRNLPSLLRQFGVIKIQCRRASHFPVLLPSSDNFLLNICWNSEEENGIMFSRNPPSGTRFHMFFLLWDFESEQSSIALSDVRVRF